MIFPLNVIINAFEIVAVTQYNNPLNVRSFSFDETPPPPLLLAAA
jgi:hypothetical protein